jgi:membrane-associated phospholipid phosphatase
VLAAAPLSSREQKLLAGLVGALVLVSVGVVSGAFTRVDQFALDHFMPWLKPGVPPRSDRSGFWVPFRFHTSNALKLLDVLTYPCSVVVSGLVVGIAAIVLWPRLGPIAALGPAVAWLAGNAIEVSLKNTLVRPALYGSEAGTRVHVLPYDGSFASGHMMRGIVVAYTLTLIWSRASPWVWIWAALVGPALVLQSAHTPSDVVGGALIGLLVLVPVHAAVRRARRERAPV